MKTCILIVFACVVAMALADSSEEKGDGVDVSKALGIDALLSAVESVLSSIGEFLKDIYEALVGLVKALIPGLD